jgi:hypothetical protein
MHSIDDFEIFFLHEQTLKSLLIYNKIIIFNLNECVKHATSFVLF